MKHCTMCGEVKDETQFYRVTRRGKVTLRLRCKECSRTEARDHSSDERPAGRRCTVCGEWKPISAFYAHRICRYGIEPMCKDCKRRKRRERDALHPDRVRRMDLKAKYGITLEEYEAMRVRQAGRCAICGRADHKLVVDHDHVTGAMRSLLCHLCNAMIGCAREDADILLQGAAYLRPYASADANVEAVAALAVAGGA